jgi:hypothetical protein
MKKVALHNRQTVETVFVICALWVSMVVGWPAVSTAQAPGTEKEKATGPAKEKAAGEIEKRAAPGGPEKGIVPPKKGGTAVGAGTTVECKDRNIHITSGAGGKCEQGAMYTTCSDGKGNTASASCDSGCGLSKGKGDCTIMPK